MRQLQKTGGGRNGKILGIYFVSIYSTLNITFTPFFKKPKIRIRADTLQGLVYTRKKHRILISNMFSKRSLGPETGVHLKVHINIRIIALSK